MTSSSIAAKKIDALRRRRGGKRVWGLWRHVLRRLRRGVGVVHGGTAALASPADSPHVNLLDTASAGLEATGAAAFPGKNAQEATAQAGCRQGRIS